MKSGVEKVVSYINKRLGQELTTKEIATRTGVSLRSVQVVCRGIKKSYGSAEYVNRPKGLARHRFVYIFSAAVDWDACREKMKKI